MIKTDKTASVLLGSWSSNYQSWRELESKNKYLLVKYEDLISNRKKIFLEILEFIYQLNGSKLTINDEKLKAKRILNNKSVNGSNLLYFLTIIIHL